MPDDNETGKGKIYNPTRNVRSDSQAARVGGKMCKRGEAVGSER
jgi:hypothetical protein